MHMKYHAYSALSPLPLMSHIYFFHHNCDESVYRSSVWSYIYIYISVFKISMEKNVK
jgi:hypothetical protein